MYCYSMWWATFIHHIILRKKSWITCDWYWADSASMIIFSDPSIFHLISFSLLLCVGWINHNSRLPAQACWVTFFTLQYRITSLRKLNYGAKVNILAWFHLFVWKQHLSHLKYEINSHSTTISSFKVWFSFCYSNIICIFIVNYLCVFFIFQDSIFREHDQGRTFWFISAPVDILLQTVNYFLWKIKICRSTSGFQVKHYA